MSENKLIPIEQSDPIEKLLSEILIVLKSGNRSNKLWTIDDLVDYFQTSRSTVSRKIVVSAQ